VLNIGILPTSLVAQAETYGCLMAALLN